MSACKNEVLAEIDDMIPPQFGKVHQVMLFTLLDDYVNGTIPEKNFLEDLKTFLRVE
jgi:hypothetical protein